MIVLKIYLQHPFIQNLMILFIYNGIEHWNIQLQESFSSIFLMTLVSCIKLLLQVFIVFGWAFNHITWSIEFDLHIDDPKDS
jgi:hypothetical protein